MAEQSEQTDETRPSSRPSGSQARDGAFACLFFGAAAVGVGVALAASNHPGAETGPFGRSVDTGSQAGYVWGLVVAGVGSVVLWVGVIACGVLMGIRAARDD